MASDSRPRKPRATPTRDALTRAQVPAGFLEAWNRLVANWELPALPPRRGRKPRVPLRDLLPALTFHVLSETGTLSEHFSQLFDAPLADSSWADRRARLPWEIFADLMHRVLRPQATRRQPDAFWRGWRVVALDGAQFSLTNPPQILDNMPKAGSRRGRAGCDAGPGGVRAGGQSLRVASPPRSYRAEDQAAAGWQPSRPRADPRQGRRRIDSSVDRPARDSGARRPHGPSDARAATVD